MLRPHREHDVRKARVHRPRARGVGAQRGCARVNVDLHVRHAGGEPRDDAHAVRHDVVVREEPEVDGVCGGLRSAQPEREGKRRTGELCGGVRVDVCARCGAHGREQQATHVAHERAPVHVQPKPAHPGVGEDLEAEVIVDEEKDGEREGGVGEQGGKAHGAGTVEMLMLLQPDEPL